MADLAKLARCSVMTISLALRDSPRVSQKQRERIKALAAKHAYRPNPLVSALNATRRRKRAFQATLAFLAHFETSRGWEKKFPAYGALRDGFSARADALGYAVEEVWTRDPEMPVRRRQKILEARGIQGLLVAPLLADGSTLPAMEWTRFSVLTVGYSVRDPDFHRVSHDYFHGMTTALARTRAAGYKRIGFFVDRQVNRVLFNLWLAAYLAEQKTTVGAPRIEPLLMGPGDEGELLKWARREKLDAVVGVDVWSIGERGMSLPPGIKLVALNADDAPGPICGIGRDFAFIGRAAAERLVALLHANETGAPERPQTTLVEGVWADV